jgi:uncharacterized UPF0146 family protein
MSKDWIGNAESAFKQLGASNHCSDDREENDFYATDPRAITDLVYRENFSKDIWECAVGQGHLAQRLKEYGFNVKCSDIVDRGYPNTEIVDFLKTTIKFNGDIVTNPPYKYCAEFILKALESVENGQKVAMFLKLQTLEGSKRYEEIYSKYPPKTIYVYVKRIQCAKNGEFKGSSAVCYAWFVWQKGFKGDTVLKWIN